MIWRNKYADNLSPLFWFIPVTTKRKEIKVLKIKGTVSVMLSDPPCKDDNADSKPLFETFIWSIIKKYCRFSRLKSF